MDQARWAYREFARIGHMFFVILWEPRSSPQFVAFVKNAMMTTLRVPPFHQRLLAAATTHALVPQFNSFVDYMRSDPAVVPECPDPIGQFGDILREYACQFAILGPAGNSGLPFSGFLCMSYLTHMEAAARMKEGFLDYSGIDNIITHVIRGRSGEPFWNPALTDEINTGLGITSLSQYTRLASRPAEPTFGGRAPNDGFGARDAAAQRGGPQVNGGAPGATQGGQNNRAAQKAPPPSDPSTLRFGPINIGHRCFRCAKLGHQSEHCPGPCHPAFSARQPSLLLKLMSHGTYPLPN